MRRSETLVRFPNVLASSAPGPSVWVKDYGIVLDV